MIEIFKNPIVLIAVGILLLYMFGFRIGAIFNLDKSTARFDVSNPYTLNIVGNINTGDVGLKELKLHVQEVNPNYAGSWVCSMCPYGAVQACDTYCRSNNLGTYHFPSEGTPCTNMCGFPQNSQLQWVRMYIGNQMVYEWVIGKSLSNFDVDVRSGVESACSVAYANAESCRTGGTCDGDLMECLAPIKLQANANGGFVTFSTYLSNSDLKITDIPVTTTTTTAYQDFTTTTVTESVNIIDKIDEIIDNIIFGVTTTTVPQQQVTTTTTVPQQQPQPTSIVDKINVFINSILNKIVYALRGILKW
jgi:hypothetical protein